MLLEIACFNPESAIAASQAGADRIELCSDYSAGGITPSHQIIKSVREKISIPLFVMIRPRGGDFFYNRDEFEIMKNEILFCKELKIDGVVFGILNRNASIDVDRCKELVEITKPLSVTFHRAFDMTAYPFQSLEKIISIGCHRILTSGKKPTATEGAELISKIIKHANGRIIIIPGGGIRAENILEIKNKTSAVEFHSAALKTESEIADAEKIFEMKNKILIL